MTFEVCYTLDDSNGRYPDPQVWNVYEGEGEHGASEALETAVSEAESLTKIGKAAFVRRWFDGAVLAPDGLWLIPGAD